MARTKRPTLDQHTPPATKSPVSQETPKRERGTVVNTDADGHIYYVATARGRVPMPRLRAFPGDIGLIPNGTPVVVDYSLGEPYIVGILPPESTRTSSVATPVTGVSGYGGQDPVLAPNYGATARAADEPNDFLPGDVVHRSPDGATLTALHGPVAGVSASPLAQIHAFGDTDLVRIVAGVLQLITWMGEVKVLNEDGKTSLVVRLGSDQLTQTGADEERYTIRFDAGHRGDLLNLEVTTPQGQTLFRWHVDGTGKLEVYAAGGIDQTDCGAEQPVRVAGSRVTEVRGSDTERVEGEAASSYGANRAVTVSSNESHVVGQDLSESILRNWRLDVNGKTVQTFGDDVDVTLRNGDVTIKASSGEVTIDAASSIRLKTALPEQVLLGRNPSFHAVKYETLATMFASFLVEYNAFKAAVVGHIHPVVLTPAQIAQTSPVFAPLAQPTVMNTAPCRSDDVLL